MGKSSRERELEAENKRLRAELERECERVRALEEIVKELKAALNRALSQSAASPSTPSGQKPPHSKPSKPKQTRRKKPGRKPGHPGCTRKKPKKIDGTQSHKMTTCPHCGKPVKQLLDKDGNPAVRKRTIEDIINEAMAAIEHHIHQYWCHNCSRRVEPPVTEALPKANLGLRLIVTTAVQHYLYGVSISRIIAMLWQQYGIKVTAGGLLQHWYRLAAWLRFQYQIVQAVVQDSGVLHADETGWRVNGQTWWLWCFATKQHVLYILDESRSGDVPRDLLLDCFEGTLITDFYAAYNACEAKTAQFCLAHLFREFKKIRAKHGSDLSDEYRRFERRLSRLFREAIQWSARSGASPPDAREAARRRFEARARNILEEEYSDPDVVRLQKRLWRHFHGLFEFVANPDVEPTNNRAESAIRPAVIMRKNSYGNQSTQGAETQAILMTVFRTMEVQKKEVIPHTISLLEQKIISEHGLKYDPDAAEG